METLKGLKVAILVENGFEQVELVEPRRALDQATYYGGGAIGYVDYLTLAQERGEEPKPQVDERWR